jgi:formate hydrogenlyase subunit 6/NADH:ubiquinone oxidoreductase subunit I
MTAIINETELADFIAILINEEYRVIAPTQDDDRIILRPITHSSQWHQTPIPTLNSIKDFILPMYEELFQYTPEGEIHENTYDTQQTIFLGIRPCDAQAIQRLDLVFQSTHEDEYYMSKRQASILIGVACNTPHNTCFCTSLNGGPHNTSGLDVVVTQLERMFLIEAVSKKGQHILKHVQPFSHSPTPQQRNQAVQLKQQAESHITRWMDTTNLLPRLTRSFNTEYWREIAQQCISCGICTFLCPTCHCFNITDEDRRRVKFWDSCQFPAYSKHTNGHNPRSEIYQRLRNRILHKFLYFQQNFNQYLCVGCGRCNQYCPMHLDLITMVSDVKLPGEIYNDK